MHIVTTLSTSCSQSKDPAHAPPPPAAASSAPSLKEKEEGSASKKGGEDSLAALLAELAPQVPTERQLAALVALTQQAISEDGARDKPLRRILSSPSGAAISGLVRLLSSQDPALRSSTVRFLTLIISADSQGSLPAFPSQTTGPAILKRIWGATGGMALPLMQILRAGTAEDQASALTLVMCLVPEESRHKVLADAGVIPLAAERFADPR